MRPIVGPHNEKHDVGQQKGRKDTHSHSLSLSPPLLIALNCAHMASAGITEETDLLVLGSCYLHEKKAIGLWAVM